MHSDSRQCVLCDRMVIYSSGIGFETVVVDCPNCGSYHLAQNEWSLLPAYLQDQCHREQRYILSGYIRELQDRNLPKPPIIMRSNITDLLALAHPPKTLVERLERVLLYIYKQSDQMLQKVSVNPQFPAFVYARSSEEFQSLLAGLTETGWVTKATGAANGLPRYKLTLDGAMRAESLHHEQRSNQCFVAMWFGQEIRDVYTNTMKPTIEATGYDALTIDERQHNDDVCDRIIAEIRRSRFMVADFTRNRGGVYFEAGFAMGLGIPVIFTCRSDWFTAKKSRRCMMHFDIEHYSFVVWKNEDDLRKKLTDRILATIPLRVSAE